MVCLWCDLTSNPTSASVVAGLSTGAASVHQLREPGGGHLPVDAQSGLSPWHDIHRACHAVLSNARYTDGGTYRLLEHGYSLSTFKFVGMNNSMDKKLFTVWFCMFFCTLVMCRIWAYSHNVPVAHFTNGYINQVFERCWCPYTVNSMARWVTRVLFAAPGKQQPFFFMTRNIYSMFYL